MILPTIKTALKHAMRNNRSYAIAILTAGILCGCSGGSPTQSPSGADQSSTRDNSTNSHTTDASKVNDGKVGESNGAATTADSKSDSDKVVGSSSTKGEKVSSVSAGHASDDRPPAPDEASIQAPTSKGDLVLAATHIKEAWHRQIPFTKLTPFELKTYREIYYKKLPKERLQSWDKFLAQAAPSSAPSSRPRTISPSSMTPITLPGMPSSNSSQ